MTHTTIAVTTDFFECQSEAKVLARRLQLPFISNDNRNAFAYLLMFTQEGLALKKNHSNTKPLIINFFSPEMRYRLKKISPRKELLARALGKPGSGITIIDATAGLARDSLIMAALGYSIILIERSPIVHALVENALERAAKIKELAVIIQKMKVIPGDAIKLLPSFSDPSIIYLDPMFRESKKSALSKHNMRIFHEVVGKDEDGDQLLKVALACATQRVVVKRPRLALPLANISPSFSLEGSSNRFDIYLTQGKNGYITSSD